MRALVAPLLLLALLAPPTHAAPLPVSMVVGVGTIQHTYVTEGTCASEARAVLQFDTRYNKITLLSDTPCIPGYYSVVTQCTGGAGQRIACLREAPGVHIHAYLEPDGAFDFAWIEDGDFDERITGTLARVET